LFFGSEEADRCLGPMLAMGASKPWPDVPEQLTGSRTMDAGAMVEYAEPVLGWLKVQNQDHPVGW
jgi:peptidyl-dipeptidase A